MLENSFKPLAERKFDTKVNFVIRISTNISKLPIKKVKQVKTTPPSLLLFVLLITPYKAKVIEDIIINIIPCKLSVMLKGFNIHSIPIMLRIIDIIVCLYNFSPIKKKAKVTTNIGLQLKRIATKDALQYKMESWKKVILTTTQIKPVSKKNLKSSLLKESFLPLKLFRARGSSRIEPIKNLKKLICIGLN